MASVTPLPRLRILILTALLTEAGPLVRAFGLRAVAGMEMVWERDGVGLMVVGIGVRRELPAGVGAEGIVLAGLGGGLDPGLKIGEVVADFDGTVIHSSEVILATAEEKRRVYEGTGKRVVDMETGRVRQIAAGCGAAFVSIRGISDTASEGLDGAVLGLVDGFGRVRFWRVVGLVVMRPWKIGGLMRLKKSSDVAMGNVVAEVKRVIGSGWPGQK